MKKQSTSAIATPPPGSARVPRAPPAPTLELDVDVTSDALAAPDAFPSGAGAAAAPPASWPAIAASDAELEDQLARGLAGLFDAAAPLAAVTARVAQALSPLERSVLFGESPGFDATAVRNAALMRLRVAAALDARPPPGSAIDEGALSTLLSEIDRLLSEVSALAARAPQPVQVALDAVRSALVKEAIDLSEAAQALASSGTGAAPAAVRTPRPAAATRLLSVSPSDASAPAGMARGKRALVAALVLVVGAGGAWHYQQYRARHADVEPLPTVPGAPAGAFAVEVGDGAQIVQSSNGKFAPGELDALRDAQAARGKTVEEVGPGVALVRPSASARGR